MLPAGGDTTQAAQAYYQYLWSVFLGSIPPDRTKIDWTGLIFIFLFLFIIGAFFYTYVRYALRAHRKRGELYGVQSFAGSILERLGPVEVFTWFIFISSTLWALYYIVTQIIHGYTY